MNRNHLHFSLETNSIFTYSKVYQLNIKPYQIGEVEVQTVKVINLRMTTLTIDERIECRSIRRVNRLMSDVILNKGHIVM